MTLYHLHGRSDPNADDRRLTWRGLLLAAVLALFGWGALLGVLWIAACIVGVMG